MTTRPGYVWDATASEWVEIGQAAVVSPFKYQATAPSSPATGDIWIDSDDDVPSIDSSVFYRWKKTAVGGETTLSGADDASLLLKYTPGYEELYINGVLQVRGSDYVATTGTTITGLTALVAGDIVTIMSQVAYTVGDTYTQGAADAKFVNKNVGGLNLVVPTSVTGGTVSANGAVTIGSAVSSVTVNDAFSAAYDNYKIIISGGSCTSNTDAFLRIGGVTTGYYRQFIYTGWNTSVASDSSTNDTRITYVGSVSANGIHANIDISAPFLNKETRVMAIGGGSSTNYIGTVNGLLYNTNSYTSFTFAPAGGTMTGGTIRIYGYNNGA